MNGYVNGFYFGTPEALEAIKKAEAPKITRAVEVGGIPPIGATGVVDPWTHFAMQAYREDGLSETQLSYLGRQIGYVDERGQPTEAWTRAYEIGFMEVEPRPLPPIDAGMPLSGIPFRQLTKLEQERADIFPYFLPLASLGETGSRIAAGKLFSDIEGAIKWLLVLAAIGAAIYFGIKVWKKI